MTSTQYAKWDARFETLLRRLASTFAVLVTLMAEKQFEAINVSELVWPAQIGRATFYRSFDAIKDVLRWRCEQIVGEMIDYVISDNIPKLLERLDVPAEYVDYWPVIRSSMAVTILVQWG